MLNENASARLEKNVPPSPVADYYPFTQSPAIALRDEKVRSYLSNEVAGIPLLGMFSYFCSLSYMGPAADTKNNIFEIEVVSCGRLPGMDMSGKIPARTDEAFIALAPLTEKIEEAGMLHVELKRAALNGGAGWLYIKQKN